MKGILDVFTTFSSLEEAQSVSSAIVNQRLAACSQLFGPVKSIYWWKGKVEESQEWIVSFKTTAEVYKKLEDAIKMLHSYEVPQILAFRVSHGSREYMKWVRQNVNGKSGSRTL